MESVIIELTMFKTCEFLKLLLKFANKHQSHLYDKLKWVRIYIWQ